MKLLSIVSTALLVAGAATASSGFDDNVDKLLLVSRQNGAVSQEKQDALAERYFLDHPGGEEFEEEHERAMGRRGVQDRILTAKRHQHIARHQKKQCKSKGKGAKKQQQHKSGEHKSSAANAGQQSYKQQSSSSQHHQHGDKKKSGKSDDGDGNGDSDGSKKSKHGGSSSSNSHSHSGSDVNGGKGLFGMSFEGSQCSSPDASEQHPNGSPGFLTCGISKSNRNSKWNPPNVKLSDIKMISADKAAQSDVFKPCAKYKSTFEQVSQEVGIPAVLLMSFALQESTCNAGLTGANGEIGISQITPDKCGGAPGGNCHDVHFNLKTAANYFKNTLDNQCNGNALCAAGQYNGWQANKMTYASATNQQYGCMAQNNLDYLNQLFNGFCQGKSGYSGEFAVYSNIAHC